MPVSGRFAGAEQVEVGAVEHQHDGLHKGISTVIIRCGDKMY
jgi:hypothetical protein